MRLDKFLVESGIGSRSIIKEYIKKGRVKVNGEIAKKPDAKIDENIDDISLDDKRIFYTKYEYYMLNKPAGIVSATTDARDATVVSLIKDSNKDIFPVGRLDKDTEGLLLITNDGELAHKLLSPKKHVDKVYYAKVSGVVTDDTVRKFREGLKISEDFIAMPADLEVLHGGNVSEVKITIREGKFHQIKRMFKAVGMEVVYLKRIAMKNLVLDDNLKPGEYRKLTDKELDELKA